MKKTDRDYLFLSSMLKAREATMLSADTLERMLAAGSFAEAAKILAELGWPDVSGLDRAGVDAALSARREEVFAEVHRFAPEKELPELFRLRYDYHNAKAVIKGEGAGVDAAYLLSGAGRVSREKLEDAFREEDYRFIPTVLGAAMREARDVLARTGNPQLADIVLDRACFAEMKALADALDNRFVSRYVELSVDGANLRTCVRCLRIGKDAEFLRSALIPGGSLSVDRLSQIVTAGEGVTAAFAGTVYAEAAALGAEAVHGGRLTDFELACDNMLMRYLRNARMAGFGPQLVAGYLAAEENNITAARMILTGLQACLSPERIKERLRETYA